MHNTNTRMVWEFTCAIKTCFNYNSLASHESSWWPHKNLPEAAHDNPWYMPYLPKCSFLPTQPYCLVSTYMWWKSNFSAYGSFTIGWAKMQETAFLRVPSYVGRYPWLIAQAKIILIRWKRRMENILKEKWMLHPSVYSSL